MDYGTGINFNFLIPDHGAAWSPAVGYQRLKVTAGITMGGPDVVGVVMVAFCVAHC